MAFDVFISHSTKDKLVADAACAALEAAHIRCWIAPRDILPGADWSASIIDALDQCRALVLIFSANANESPQIRNEVVHAVQRGVPVIPVRIEDIAPAKSLAYFMGAVHWLDALSPPIEDHLKRLAESVRAMLELMPAPQGGGRTETAATPIAPAAGALQSSAAEVADARSSASEKPHRDSAASPQRLRSRMIPALAGAIAVLVIVAGVLLLRPTWESLWPQKPSSNDAATQTRTGQAASAPLTDLLLVRLASALPDHAQQVRERIAQEYVQAQDHKAQAVALQPQGAWRAGARPTAQFAEEAALENCQIAYDQPCALIAVNGSVQPLPERGNWLRRDMPRVRYAGNFDPNQIPGVAHLRQRKDIAGYAAASGPKAAAYHPTSQVFIVTGAASQREAEERVLDVCNKDTTRAATVGVCYLYAAGNQVVLPQRLRKPMS